MRNTLFNCSQITTGHVFVKGNKCPSKMASNSHLLTILKGTTLANICMCNEIVTSEVDLNKTRVKLFPNFTSIPFDYLLMSLVTNYVRNRGVLTDMFILHRIDRSIDRSRTLLSQTFRSEIWLTFSQFFDKIRRILLDVIFRLFRFLLRVFLCPDIFIHDILKLRRH